MARPVKESNEEYVRNLALIEKFDFRGLAFRFHFRTARYVGAKWLKSLSAMTGNKRASSHYFSL